MTTGALALAASLAALDRRALTALVEARLPRAVDGVQDPLTLALELLKGDSIARALSVRNADELAVLARLGTSAGTGTASGSGSGSDASADASDPAVDSLTGLGLIGRDGEAPAGLPEVAAALDSSLAAVGLSREALLASAPASSVSILDPETADAPDDPWYGAALTTVARTAAILRALQQRPGRVNRRGTIAVTLVRGLSEQFGIDPAAVQRCLRTMECAGLTATVPSDPSGGGSLVIGRAGLDWLDLPHPERWALLADARIGALGPQAGECLTLMPGDTGEAASRLLTARYPLLPETARAAAIEAADAFEDLGLSVGRALTTPARAAISADDKPAGHDPADRLSALTRSARDHMPAAVDAVYLQPDLSVIVPGPLAPDDERLLSSVSEAEQVGVASTLRITPDALARAVESGATPDGLRTELERLSVTGVPQPLSFLIEELSRRDSIVVRSYFGDEGRTIIEVSRPETVEMLRVDRALQHLQLHPADGISADGPSSGNRPLRLRSRLGTDHVLTTLLDARYPATRGSIPTGAGQSGAAGSATAKDSEAERSAAQQRTEALEALVDRVMSASDAEPGEADVARRLDLAIRDRSKVRLTAEARGREYEFLLLPVSLSGGRLRATDEAAGVERTLPLSAITAVAPA